MDWICLGHAMWLVEGAGLRILFDPLLGPTHHADVFEVVPRRTIDVAALRPDIIAVSHRHGDHFDVPTLHRLARLYPRALIVTADPLVDWAARALGFADVKVVDAGYRFEFPGLTMVTMPSLARDEWGAMIATTDGVAWNQIDSVLPDPPKVRKMVETILQWLGAPHVALALARWQPLLEIAAQLGRSTAFPYAEYDRLLRQIVAVQARAVVPSAAGASHTAAFRWLDRYEFPVSERRFLRDLSAIAPECDGFPAIVGARYRVRDHAVEFHETGAADLVAIERAPDPRVYKPVAIPPLCDPNPAGGDEAIMRPVVRRFIEHDLAQGLLRNVTAMAGELPLRLCVEVVFGSCVDAYTLVVDAKRVHVTRDLDDDWDALNTVAGSLLWEVIEGRRHWGEVLLAGALRGSTRAYAIADGRLTRARVPETFIYYGLSYDDAVERAVRWRVERALASD